MSKFESTDELIEGAANAVGFDTVVRVGENDEGLGTWTMSKSEDPASPSVMIQDDGHTPFLLGETSDELKAEFAKAWDVMYLLYNANETCVFHRVLVMLANGKSQDECWELIAETLAQWKLRRL